jgi:hypothetical protein
MNETHAANEVDADVDDVEAYGVDFTKKLPAGVTVTSAEIEQSNNDDLEDIEIGEPEVNGTEYVYRGRTIAAGKLVLFEIGPLADGAVGTYRLKVKATCSDSSKVRVIVCTFNVYNGLTF